MACTPPPRWGALRGSVLRTRAVPAHRCGGSGGGLCLHFRPRAASLPSGIPAARWRPVCAGSGLPRRAANCETSSTPAPAPPDRQRSAVAGFLVASSDRGRRPAAHPSGPHRPGRRRRTAPRLVWRGPLWCLRSHGWTRGPPPPGSRLSSRPARLKPSPPGRPDRALDCSLISADVPSDTSGTPAGS